MRILDRIRRLKPTKEEEKEEMPTPSLKQKISIMDRIREAPRDKYGLRPVDYLLLVVSAIITFLLCCAFEVRLLESLLVTVLVVFIIYLVLRKLPLVAPEVRYGWAVAWIDDDGFYKSHWEHNLRITYGRIVRMPDGVPHLLKDSELATYYKARNMKYIFNPFLNGNLLGEIEQSGQKVIWCDGTDMFSSPMELVRFRLQAKESPAVTPKAIRRTTAFMQRRKK